MQTKLVEQTIRILSTRKRFTRTEIIGFRKILNQVPKEQAAEILELANKGGFELTPKQTKFALSWLENRIWKASGELRDSKESAAFGFRERGIIQTFVKFTFEGFRHTYNAETGKYSALAMYRCHGETGDSFLYTVDFWGRPEVIG